MNALLSNSNQKNYQTDNSLFAPIIIPGQWGLAEIMNWLEKDQHARTRIITDYELDADYPSVSHKLAIYPGIMTFSVVSNPWFRMACSYLDLRDRPSNHFSRCVDLSTLETFIHSIEDRPLSGSWFTLATNQSDWLFDNDRKTNFIFQYETLEIDFEVLKSYFLSNIDIRKEINYREFDYKAMYSEGLKKRIEHMFYKDIDIFQYTF